MRTHLGSASRVVGLVKVVSSFGGLEKNLANIPLDQFLVEKAHKRWSEIGEINNMIDRYGQSSQRKG